MIHTPKVTVIITTYNRANLLPRAVESVLAQTYTDYEIVIVDDCSSDNTQEVIAGFDDPRIRSFRHERNRGQSAAQNTGISTAKGQYVAFLDDDDEYLPVNLEARVHRLDKASCKVGLVYGWRDEVDDSTGEVRPYIRQTLEGDLFEYLLGLNPFGGTLDIMVRLSLALEIEGFDESFDLGEDAHLIARIAQRYHVALVPQIISRQHIKHGLMQKTDLTFEGNLAHAKFFRAYLHFFADEFDRRPKAQASVLRRLVLSELRCRNWGASLSAAATSFRLDPLGTIGHGARYCYRRLMGRWPT